MYVLEDIYLRMYLRIFNFVIKIRYVSRLDEFIRWVRCKLWGKLLVCEIKIICMGYVKYRLCVNRKLCNIGRIEKRVSELEDILKIDGIKYVLINKSVVCCV